MKFLAVLVCFFSSLVAATFDIESDVKIARVLNSSDFSSTQINYTYNGEVYPVQLIFNPADSLLWGSILDKPVSFQLLLVGDLPFQLSRHLMDLVAAYINEEANTHFDLNGNGNLFMEAFKTVVPVYIATTINDTRSDKEITKAFSTNTFNNQVFYYYLNDTYYKVRILHNPEQREFVTSGEYSFSGTSRTEFPVSWNYRYGIMTSRETPQSLIDHIAELANSAWNDWYWNFDIQNGTAAIFTEDGWGEIINYELDTWYEVSEYFH